MTGTGTYVATAATVVGASLLLVAYRDYRAYVALGPHGLPDTFWGWYKQLKLSRKARKDTTVPAPYQLDQVKESAGPNGTKSYLNKLQLPQRTGPRPKIPGFTAPQRQTSAVATADMKEQMNAYLRRLVARNPDALQSELSVLEGPVPAVQLKQGIERPPYLRVTRGEMIHVHPPDGSTHVVLSLTDSRSVIEQGWGQRHRLSGGLLGWGYTFIYAPRDQGELEVWKNIVCAAARYCCAEITEIGTPTMPA
ncbi:hypothetical protein AAL_06890 [Moelleriella libera RCEF 2490]|uniref:Luciferase domain-containing protein n=1 Tax=Moelleriella libera RCEF 2490 TaxID=1081109 RepID=A0A167YCD5_9HYPO|nr:hypothetical protein AAL_06890 [Moelleriella libera RCEF 2490]